MDKNTHRTPVNVLYSENLPDFLTSVSLVNADSISLKFRAPEGSGG